MKKIPRNAISYTKREKKELFGNMVVTLDTLSEKIATMENATDEEEKFMNKLLSTMDSAKKLEKRYMRKPKTSKPKKKRK